MGSSYGFVNSPNMDHIQESDKTRMLVQARSQGDGMETSSAPETPTRSFHNFSKEIHENCPNNYVPPTMKRKEPKFVPYEPYKAAVSPIIPTSKERITGEKVIIDPSLIKPLMSKVIKESSTGFSPKKTQSVDANSTVVVSNLGSSVEHTSVDSSSWLHEKVLLEDRIRRLEDDKKEMTAQFNIQTKVNADLKKLLIASLGEDMQAKVQYMSEDKAKLGEHVLLCSQKLSQNNEELEKLSLQRDMWKSKFEASSLLVDELGGWKIVLSRKFNEATEVIQCLLEEHRELFEQSMQTFSTLHSVQEAFDPSAKKNSPCPQSPWNISQLASATRALSEDIQNRLLGSSASQSHLVGQKLTMSSTRGEHLAKELVDSLENLPALTKLEMNKKNGIRPCGQVCSVTPHACLSGSTVNCCKHCSGKVKYV